MKTRAVIMAGGEGSRLGTLTSKRTKPAVPFAGKYRIIDFTLSNCVNSRIFDVMILAQYRPHSLIEHIGSGGPWDLNRDFTGGVRIYSPYKARGSSEWYLGTADAVQQNFRFIKSSDPDFVLVLSGDHIYVMNYDALIAFHVDHQADVTICTIRVPLEEAPRFGILNVDKGYRVTSFEEKPRQPSSNLINMGVYLFNIELLDKVLWEDRTRSDSSHDFGKDILPYLVATGARVFAFPYTGYWVDVGTVGSYWQAHMDLIKEPASIDLNDRSWIIHTRTEERPPVRISAGAKVIDSMVTDGGVLSADSVVERSVLSPGVRVMKGAVVRESVILTDAVIEAGAVVERAIIDKRVRIGKNAIVGGIDLESEPVISMIGKNSHLPEGIRVEPGAIIATDVIPTDFSTNIIRSGDYIQTKRLAYEV
ncbi:MAG: NTP transferase domain-containing protein [Chloroflexota bacterium]|nr:MAG: NTP transferase domain-containing protein [Chloroflexota bacterium]